jgi:hypothetical protein
MAIRIPIITDLQDKGIRDAKKAFGDFKTSVANAEGGLGKFKAGSKSIFDAVQANAVTFGIAAGAAVVGFAKTSITAFQDVALAAGAFADATGLAVEDASRYIEAAGDIGIPVDAVEGAIGRLNKTIGADPDKVRNLGVDLVYLRDGSLDVNETFKNTIQRIKDIKDPAEKAKVAAQLLGKGWQSMSELIEMGASGLDTALKNVGDAQVIDQDELRKAKEFRDTMDDFGDKAKALAINFGEFLVPIISDIVELIDETITGLGDMYGWLQKQWNQTYFATAWDEINITAGMMVDDIKTGLGDIFGMFSDKKEVIPVFAEDMALAREDAKTFKTALQDARNPLNELKTAADNASTAIINADTAWKNLTGTLEREVALDNAETDLKELEAAAIKAFGTGAQQDINDYERETLEYLTALQTISGTMDSISQKEIAFRFSTQGPAAAQEFARYLSRGAEYGGLSQADALGLAGISGFTLPARAMGGPVSPSGGPYIVGERGPELFTPGSSGNITPNNALGGGGITVNVNGGDPNQILRVLQQYVRQTGPLPINTRAM